MHHKLSDDELDPRPNQRSPQAPTQRPMTCAKCGQSYQLVDRKLLPFCSVRCQQLDLASWLDEDYGLPFEGDKSGQEVEYLDDPTEP